MILYSENRRSLIVLGGVGGRRNRIRYGEVGVQGAKNDRGLECVTSPFSQAMLRRESNDAGDPLT
jgi:hypothetical protein